MYISFFDSLNLLLMFALWISVVLQSLRPKIHFCWHQVGQQ